jgi:hypothetical protein
MATFADQEAYSKIKQSAELSAKIFGVPVGGDFNQLKETVAITRLEILRVFPRTS